MSEEPATAVAPTSLGGGAAKKVGRNVAGLLAAGFGAVAGKYAGMSLLFPGVIGYLTAVAIKKFAPSRSLAFRWVVAAQTGQCLWMAFGVSTVGAPTSIVVETIMYVALTAWVAVRPRTLPVHLCLAYQAFSVIVNIAQFTGADFGTIQHKALMVHCIFRMLALWFLVKLRSELKSAGGAAPDAQQPSVA